MKSTRVWVTLFALYHKHHVVLFMLDLLLSRLHQGTLLSIHVTVLVTKVPIIATTNCCETSPRVSHLILLMLNILNLVVCSNVSYTILSAILKLWCLFITAKISGDVLQVYYCTFYTWQIVRHSTCLRWTSVLRAYRFDVCKTYLCFVVFPCADMWALHTESKENI